MSLAPPVRLQQIRISVPRQEWAAIATGIKTEFRVAGRRATTKFPAPTPTPALIYIRDAEGDDARLVVLEETWSELLGEISDESIAREGAKDRAEFRQRWCARNNVGFRPLDPVRVYRVRKFTPADLFPMGQVLLERLYGSYL